MQPSVSGSVVVEQKIAKSSIKWDVIWLKV